ncbi:MAG: hypothetical protein ACJASP_000700 [Roseivirga sp.]|jgi:hypothetical protein
MKISSSSPVTNRLLYEAVALFSYKIIVIPTKVISLVFFGVFETNKPILDLINVLPDENIITISDENLGSFIVGPFRVVPQIVRPNIGAMIGMEFFSEPQLSSPILGGEK